MLFFFFFFNDTATTEIYTLSLHDALPISIVPVWIGASHLAGFGERSGFQARLARYQGDAPPFVVCLCRRASECPRSCQQDRKSTRLNSSHSQISYAVFCLKKKKNNNKTSTANNNEQDPGQRYD